MISNHRGEMFCKTGFIWIMVIAFTIVVNSEMQASSAKPAKPSPTQTSAKTDPNEWKKVVEAAMKEGKIVIAGVPGEAWRMSMVDMFRQEYPTITVEFTAIAGRNILPRIQQERELGKKLWDLLAGGPGTAYEFKKKGYLSPIRSLLLPELGKNIVELDDKIIRLSTGSGSLSLLEGAPHPNAARVYILIGYYLRRHRACYQRM